MEFSDKVFIDPRNLMDPNADVVFVSDMFVEDMVGGAELTSEAIIQESPFKVQKLRSREVSIATLKQGHQKFWIFGNFAQMNPELIPTIVGNLSYAIIEYDYKYCRYRSPEKHASIEGTVCDCHNQINGKMISAFYHGASMLWWMSQKQKERYHQMFPFLSDKDNFVLSSVFSKETLSEIKLLKNSIKQEEKKGWLVLGSNSWIKGFEAAKNYCEKKALDYEVVWNVPYKQLLAKLACAEGLVYLPPGGDTCPRLVIEAKLLGCNIVMNDNVQHKDEEWFDTNDVDSIHDYLFTAPGLFWKATANIFNQTPEVSGYTTTYNCISQKYPFEQSIKSMMQFCKEVCVVDGGSTDGTIERLQQLCNEFNVDEERLKVKVIERDWSHPRHAVFDGMQKAAAREMCTKKFCWQLDSDEIVHEDDYDKIIDICKKMPRGIDLVSLPVVEYWGGEEKVRLDIQPWKWRLSRNLPHITHGIPKHLRKTDSAGNACAHPGTDGCDMIHKETGEVIPHVTFHVKETEMLRQTATKGDPEAIKRYQEWFNEIVENVPGVHHYSWYDMSRKMRTYRDYWTRHWNSLYDGDLKDNSETNMMFDLPWSQVTEEMIDARAKELSEKTGGWIWHRKWDGTCIPHIKCNRSQPSVMKENS